MYAIRDNPVQSARTFGFTWDDLADQFALKRDRQGRASPGQVKIKLFLNRILNLDPEKQEALFRGFSREYEAAIERAKAAGTWDVGTETYQGAEQVQLESREEVSPDVNLVRLKARSRIRPYSFEALNNEKEFSSVSDGTAEVKWIQNIRSGRVYRIIPSPADGSKVRQHGPDPSLHRTRSRRDIFDSIEGKTRWPATSKAQWRVLDEDAARKLYEKELGQLGEWKDEQLYVLEGALLPVWDRLPRTKQLLVFNTDKGRVLGVKIPEDEVSSTLDRFGVGAAANAPAPAIMLPGITTGNYTAGLSNGWTLKRSRVGGEYRAEIIPGPAGWIRGDVTLLKQQGAGTEIIANKRRVFIPVGKPGVLERMLKGREVITWESPTARGAAKVEALDAPARALGKPSSLEAPVAPAAKATPAQALAQPVPERIEAVGLRREPGEAVDLAAVTEDQKQGKRLSKIIKTFAEDIGKKIRTASTRSRRVGGTYYPGSTRTVIRYHGDLDALAHEVAHHFDDRFDVVGWISDDVQTDKIGRKRYPRNEAFDSELELFWPHGSITKSGPRSRLPHKRAEGWAEWLRAYIVNPTEAKKLAPNLYEHYIETVPPEVLDAVDRFSQDVREFTGRSGANQLLSNVRLKPDSTMQRLVKKLRGDTDTTFTTLDPWTRWRSVMSDDLAAVEKGITHAQRLLGDRNQDVLPLNDTAILMRLYHGHAENMEAILEDGVPGPDGRPVTGGLDWLLEPMDNSSREALQRDYSDTVALLLGERVLEKAQQIFQEARERIEQMPEPDNQKSEKIMQDARERASRLAGWGGGVRSDYEVAAEALQELQQNPERYQRLQEAARRYRDWSDAVLRYMVDKGRLTEESYEQIIASNEQYAAMNRVAEDIDSEGRRQLGGKKLAAVKQPIKRFKGSTREVENPYVSLLAQTSTVINETDRNSVMQAMRNMLTLSREMYEGKPVDLDAVGSRARKGDAGAIRIFVDGKPEYWQFEEGITSALKRLGQVPEFWSTAAGKLATLPAKVLRTAVVHSPGFLTRNKIRDALQLGIISEHGAKPWELRFTKDELRQWQRAGGGQAGYFTSVENYHKAMEIALRELSKDGNNIITTPAKIARGYSKLARLSETSTRMSEYRRAFREGKRKGYDDANASRYAAYHSRGLIDFAVAGSFIRELNRVIPFTNPHVQGLKRAAKAFRSPKIAARTMMRWSLYILLPKLFELAWAKWNDEEEELAQQPPYIRDLFMSFKVGDDMWLRIPLGFDFAVYASAVSRAIDAAEGDEHAFEGLGGSIAKSLMPIDASAAAGPFRSIVELIANKDFFRGRHVIPPRDEGKALSLRPGTKYASRLGKFGSSIAEALGVEIDPRYIDHFVKSQLAELGRGLLSVSDIMREDKDSLKPLSLTRISGLTVRSPGYSARDVQAVLDRAQYLGLEQHKEVKKLRDMFSATHEGTRAERDAAKQALREEAGKIRRWIDPLTPELVDASAHIKDALQADPTETWDVMYVRLKNNGVLVGTEKSFRSKFIRAQRELAGG
jgi:hypothetical protein